MPKIFMILIILIVIAIAMYFIIKPSKLKHPELQNTIIKGSMLFDGKNRSYIYYVPNGLPQNPSLVIALHRSKSNAQDLRETMNYRYDELADKYKFIVLYPDGYEGNWNDCRKAPKDSAHKLKINDTGFIKSLIDLFKKNYSINSAQVYATGFSAGGHMCLKLAVEIPELISKIAPTLFQIPLPENYTCDKSITPLPILIVNGTDDPISPYEGGEVSILKIIKQGKVYSVNETAKHFLKLNNLFNEPIISNYPSIFDKNEIWIEKKVWKENKKFPLHQIIVHGGGHTLPGTNKLPSLIFGKTYNDYIIADDIVDFFLKK